MAGSLSSSRLHQALDRLLMYHYPDMPEAERRATIHETMLMPLATAKEVALYHRVALRTAQHWAATGVIPGVRQYGRAWLLPVESISQIEPPRKRP